MATTYTSILNDIQKWDSAGNPVRVAIAKEIAAKLGPDYMYVGFKHFSCGGQDHEIMSLEHQPTLTVFHIIPGGTFTLGVTEEEQAHLDAKGWKGDIPEHPAHEVKVRAFLLAEFTCTEHAWRAFSGTSDKPWVHGQWNPQEAVSRSQARMWCRQFGMRLPTEAEWEYACRAGTRSAFYWGNEPDHSHCWMEDNYGDKEADYANHSYREHWKKTNAFGLIDMLGSMSEWVQDDRYRYEWHDPNDGPYESDDPKTDGILRGGCFMYGWKLNRCSTRIACSDYGDTGIGFRAAKDIPALEGKVEDGPGPIGKSQRLNPAPPPEEAKKKPWWKKW